MYKDNLFLHYIIPEYFPENGGIQQSLRRISNSIGVSYINSQKNIYAFETEAEDTDNTFYLINGRDDITKPILTDNNPNRRDKNIQRVNFLLLYNKIKPFIDDFPNKKHIIVSFYASHAGFYAQLIASAFNLQHITSVRGSDFYVNFLNHTSYGSLEFVVKRADFVVTTNNFQKKLLSKLYPETKARICTIHNAIENTNFTSRDKPITSKGVRLVADCGFSYKKGTEFIINSFESILQRGYQVELKIAGDIDSKTKDFWKKLISKLNKKHKKTFEHLGFVDKIQDFISHGDIYLSASLSEGCSNSRILALCTGIPIVTTENGAITDYQFDNINIRFVPSGNQEKFTDAIIDLIETINTQNLSVSDSELNQRRNYFSVEREREEWSIVIQKILQNES